MAIVRSTDGRFYDIPDEELSKHEVKPDDLPAEQRGPQSGPGPSMKPGPGGPPAMSYGGGGGGGGMAPMQIVISVIPPGGGGGGGGGPSMGPPPGAPQGQPAESGEARDVGGRYCGWSNWANWANWRNCGWRNCR